MALVFTEHDHKYKSLDPEDKTDWISATTFISTFKQGFDAEKQSVKSSKNSRSKWFGLDPQEIRQAWIDESNRAIELGNWYHNKQEADLCAKGTVEYKGHTLPVYGLMMENGRKIASQQKLTPGLYPEHMVFLKSAGLCGQSDLPIVMPDNVLDISDYKTNKEIKTAGFTNWEGITQKMQHPVGHLDDCEFYHYALQLSLYMYIIIKHNPMLKPGKLTIHHILFEEAGRNQYDYPITARDENGDPIIKDIVYIDLPYLKQEIHTLVEWVKKNRHLIKKKK